MADVPKGTRERLSLDLGQKVEWFCGCDHTLELTVG